MTTPIGAIRTTPKRSVSRPAIGRAIIEKMMVSPVSANCDLDQPKSAIRCGAKVPATYWLSPKPLPMPTQAAAT